MDKWVSSSWFVKIVSFFIALMLYMMVNMEDVNNQPGVLPAISNATHQIEEVDLNVYYNEDEFEISDIISNVQVNLRGPQNVITLFNFARPSYEVFVDLRNLGPGTHYVKIQHEGFPGELQVVTAPQTVRVTIEEKRTVSFPITIDIVNEKDLSEGYTLGDPIVSPSTVEITAATSILDQIAVVKASVDVSGAKETINKSVPIKVYDENGQLDLNINPAVVDVKVPVTSPNKEVPLKILQKGDIGEGLSIRSIEAEPSKITIYGPKEVINEIDYIEVETDISDITESTTLEVEVSLPEGLEEVSPTVINVAIEVDVEASIQFENVEIEVVGLSDRMNTNFKAPLDGVVNIAVKGSPMLVEQITAQDIRAYADLSRLSIGTHTVPIQITGPPNVRVIPEEKEIEVTISDSSSSNELSVEESNG